MPIIGLSGQNVSGTGLPVIAKLRKGIKETITTKTGREREVPKDLDYFHVDFEPQFAYLEGLWREMYGDKPTEFAPLFLTAATVDEAFSSWKEEWNAARTLLHRCDGEFQSQHWSEAYQMYIRAKTPCVSPVNPLTGMVDAPQCACKPTGRLSAILPEFAQESGVFGCVSITTHSLNDIMTMDRYLRVVEGIYGGLIGVPFIFGRAAHEVSAPRQVKQGDEYVRDGRMKTEKSLFYIHVEPTFMREQLLPMMNKRQALPAPAAPASEIPTNDAKQMLGSGGGQRRLGAPLPQPKVEPEPTPVVRDWNDFWVLAKRHG